MTITTTPLADALNMRLGRRVRNLMFGKLTQVQMAEKIGTTQSGLSRRIHGDVDFRPYELAVVAKELGTTVDALLSETHPSDYNATVLDIRHGRKMASRPGNRNDTRRPQGRAA